MRAKPKSLSSHQILHNIVQIWEFNSMVGTTLETEKFPKILGVTLDPKLTFTKHIDATVKKS